MKNIINWTFGGFFRSLGRILCYLAIGTLISILLSYSGIKLPSIFGVIDVNASAYQTFSTSQVRMRYDERGTLKYTSWYNTNYTFDSLSYPVVSLQFRVKSSDGFSPLETYILNFGYKPSPDAISRKSVNGRKDGQTDVYESFTCQWEKGDVTYLGTCSFTPKLTYTSNDYLIINVDFNSAYLTSIRGIMNQYLERESVESVITQTTDNIVNTIDGLSDTLTDTDTSQTSSEASDFFHNFNLSIEGPISQIVLLPVNMLQYLIVDYNSSETHSDICATLKGKQICLPSGDILWKRSGCHENNYWGCPNYTNFRNFLQLVAGGFILFKILSRIVKTAEKGLDPQESGVNLMKL